MSKEKLIAKLVKYKIKHSQFENTIRIRFGSSQEMSVAFYDNNRITITDRFGKWNPLSGYLMISVRNAIMLQFALIILVWFILLLLFSTLELNARYFELAILSSVYLVAYGVFWSVYYLIKLECFKITLIKWLDE